MLKVSQEIQEIIQKESADGVVRISDFTTHFGYRSSAVIIALLALPIALPFTPPGINTPFAIACIFLSFSLILNKEEFRLPNFINNRKLPFKPDGGFFKAMTKLLGWVELVIKPRLGWVTNSKFSKPLLGLGILAASIVMIIPLPIINSLSSLIVLMVALGIVTKDGLVSLLSAIAGFLLLLSSIAIVVYGVYIGQSFFVSL
jgi:hypothetical protein